MKVFSAIFCPERTLSVLMFLYFLQGEHRQISPSGDLEEEQGTKDIAALHPGLRAGHRALQKVLLKEEVLCVLKGS